MVIEMLCYEKLVDVIGQKKQSINWTPIKRSEWVLMSQMLKTTVARNLLMDGIIQSYWEDRWVWKTNLSILKRTLRIREDQVLRGLKELEASEAIRLLSDEAFKNQPTNQPYTVDEFCQAKISSTPPAKKISEMQKAFIDYWNSTCGDRPKKKHVLTAREKKRIDEILNMYDDREISETIKRATKVDDSGWSSGKVDFYWLLRANHFERLADNGYKLK